MTRKRKLTVTVVQRPLRRGFVRVGVYVGGVEKWAATALADSPQLSLALMEAQVQAAAAFGEITIWT